MDKDLKIKYEPYIHMHDSQKEMFLFLYEISLKDYPIPQILMIARDSRDFIYDSQSPVDIDQIFKEKLLETGCYEQVAEAIFNTVEIHLNRYRYTYRITP